MKFFGNGLHDTASELLESKSVDVLLKGGKGKSLLEFAFESGDKEIIQKTIDHPSFNKISNEKFDELISSKDVTVFVKPILAALYSKKIAVESLDDLRNSMKAVNPGF